jgi:hypothetical protein
MVGDVLVWFVGGWQETESSAAGPRCFLVFFPVLGSAEINGIRDREARCEAALDRLSDGLTSSGVHGRA